MRARWVLVLPLALLVLASGCSSSARSSSAVRSDASPQPSTVALQRAAALGPCPVGSSQLGPLPAVTLACLGDGKPVRVGRLRGPMLVNVWASWCQPCYQEMPTLERLHARAGGRLAVLGVDTSDTTSRGLRAAIDTNVHYPSVADPHRQIAAALSITSQPTTVFVRADGAVAHVLHAPVGSLTALLALVRQYLGLRL